jgi:hypothetical protein
MMELSKKQGLFVTICMIWFTILSLYSVPAGVEHGLGAVIALIYLACFPMIYLLFRKRIITLVKDYSAELIADENDNQN